MTAGVPESRRTVVPPLGLDPALWRLVPWFQP